MSETKIEFDFAAERENSIKALTELFLTHPETGAELYAMEAFEDIDPNTGAPIMSIVCTDSPESTEAVVHTIQSGLAVKKTDEEIAAEMAALEVAKANGGEPQLIAFPDGLVDADGKPLSN